MDDFTIRTYRHQDRHAVVTLWRKSGLLVPWNNPFQDIDRKCADSPELFFVAHRDGLVVGSCMAGYDGHRGWLYYLAVAPGCRRAGIAAALVKQAESALRSAGCPKVELMIRASNHEVAAFYHRIGYQIDPVTVLSKRLLEDNPYRQ